MATATRVKRAKNILAQTPKRSFQSIARSKLAVKDAKRTVAIKQVRHLFKERKKTEPARRTLSDVRAKTKQAKLSQKTQLVDARRSKRKKQHVTARVERRSTRKFIKPSLKTIATGKISKEKVKLMERALYLKNIVKTEKARLAAQAKVQVKKRAKAQQVINLGRSRAIKSSYKAFQYPSSVVAALGYDPSTKIMYVEWNEGGDGYYENITMDIYKEAAGGEEYCRTTGSNIWGSWYLGKRPSRGAYIYWNLRYNPLFPYTRMS